MTGKNKNHLILLPAQAIEIERALPRTDCGMCPERNCFDTAVKISRDQTAVEDCSQIDRQLYWLNPRGDCYDCGYETCLAFAKAVNKQKASVFDCPYTYGEDKVTSKQPPKPSYLSVISRHKERLLTIPTEIFDIEDTLPKTDCKVCGYESCFLLAAQIEKDHRTVSKCPYMKARLYWLTPRGDCHDCGYETCRNFVEAVNNDKATVFDCPYSFGEDKETSTRQPKSYKSSNKIHLKERLITLPTEIFDIEYTLPMTDCKVCGYNGCFELAAEIEKDHSAVSKCPYMQYELYWLVPRVDCKDCGYHNCAKFVKAVNDDRASVFDCPYTYGKDKSRIQNKQLNTDSDNNNMIEPIVKTVGKPNKTESTLNLRFDGKKIADIKVTKKTTVYKKPERILNSIADENLTPKEKEAFFKKELQKANDLIKDETISKDLEHMRQNITDIYAMFTKHPMLHDQVHKFSTTYLPMTLDLLNEYLMLESKVLHEEATDMQQKKIAEAIGKAKVAFIKLNDDLFRQISYDIDAQIKAFDDILTIDGLLSDDDFKINKDDDTKEDR